MQKISGWLFYFIVKEIKLHKIFQCAQKSYFNDFSDWRRGVQSFVLEL